MDWKNIYYLGRWFHVTYEYIYYLLGHADESAGTNGFIAPI